VFAVLEAVRAIIPDLPGANHLYIHAVEASPFPEKGNEAADRLRQAVPVSGHLVHMPSHIDIQTGRWAQAADQNEQAIAADRRYKAKASRKQELYRVYMAHNNHMLTFAAMMEGRKARALESARTMLAAVPPDYIEAHPDWIDPYLAVPIEVLMRFGEWDTILREPAPPKNVPVSNAMWRFARAVAYAAKGDVPSAEREQARFREAVARVPSNWYVNFNPAQKLLAIAEHMLEGEIAYRRGEIDRSVAELRKAIAIEDTLMYMEPPDWPQPVRHTLGAVLVDAGRYAEAEEVYRQDLKIWPENGWALHGLATALNAQGKGAEAGEIEARFAKVWARADTDIGSSCLCVPGKKAHTVAAR
jgi:tetratricopeptide (TPR) repeat protein